MTIRGLCIGPGQGIGTTCDRLRDTLSGDLCRTHRAQRQRGEDLSPIKARFGMADRERRKKPPAAILRQPRDGGDCRHHWLIESACGTYSPGRCKLCGITRMFSNNPEDLKGGEYNDGIAPTAPTVAVW